MREIGGYIELDTYSGSMLHSDGIRLNCGRNALAHLIKLHNIRTLWMPKYMCDSCDNVLKTSGVMVKYYQIDEKFRPISFLRNFDEWIYIVNFFGQIDNAYIKKFGKRVIVDNAQAYFQNPIDGLDTIYTCRKFFGVSDGAIVYESKKSEYKYDQDISYERMNFLLGRYEKSAQEFYLEYVQNNALFKNEAIKEMSKLTTNLLCAIDYDNVRRIRTQNFEIVDNLLNKYNKLNLSIPDGAFMYPLYLDNGEVIKKQLLEKKIYVPTLWPAVFKRCDETELEYDMAKNMVPLPIDQRYNENDMKYIVNEVIKCIG